MRNKGVFFVKRDKKPLPEGNVDLADYVAFGDIHPNVLDHFCAWVEEVLVPIFKNEENISKFPQCVAYGKLLTSSIFQSIIPALDIKKQVHELATAVYQIRGHIKGRTLLPFPQVYSLRFITVLNIIVVREPQILMMRSAE